MPKEQQLSGVCVCVSMSLLNDRILLLRSADRLGLFLAPLPRNRSYKGE